jgi:hypothetical protein
MLESANAGYDVSQAQEIDAMRIAILVLLVAYGVAVKLPAAAAGDPDAATGLSGDPGDGEPAGHMVIDLQQIAAQTDIDLGA